MTNVSQLIEKANKHNTLADIFSQDSMYEQSEYHRGLAHGIREAVSTLWQIDEYNDHPPLV